ncbi:MAG: hypothetical protein J7M29_05075 [Verrucomicrobia bacterium]|nr:hypothetical protein [Verrucomicrobiota bacterium]
MNLPNQFTERTAPNVVDVVGIANPTADVTVNGVTAGRHGEYFHRVVTVDNSTGPQYVGVEAVSQFGATQSESRNHFVPAEEEHYDDPSTPEIDHGYDDDGNLLGNDRWEFIWDGENRLVKLRSRNGSPAPERRIEFEYDWQGRRIRKTVYNWDAGTESWLLSTDSCFLYDGWNLVAELGTDDGSPPTFTKVRTYVWCNDPSGTLQGADGVGGLLWITHHETFVAYDGNGNVIGLISASDGFVVAQYEYGPFAEPLRATGPLAAEKAIRFSAPRVGRFLDQTSRFRAAALPAQACLPIGPPSNPSSGLPFCGFQGFIRLIASAVPGKGPPRFPSSAGRGRRSWFFACPKGGGKAHTLG